MTDLIAFTLKKWAESKASFGNSWPMAAQTFFQQCHDLAWDRVEFKMLRFNKQAVPGDFTDNVKDIRRLRRGQRELATLAGLSLPSLGNREP